METKPVLWLFIAPLDHPDLCFALPTTAWVAKEMGAALECYLECPRQGDLFAQTGSTVLGGHHHQQFNYLHARFDVKLLLLGGGTVFASSSAVFGDETLIKADELISYYKQLFTLGGTPACLLFAPRSVTVKGPDEKEPFAAWMHNAPSADNFQLDIAPYLHAEIAFSKAAAFPEEYFSQTGDIGAGLPAHTLFTKPLPGAEPADTLKPGDHYGSLTLRLARRWKHQAKAVAFGDPDAIRAQLPTLIRQDRVSVFAPAQKKPPAAITLAAYTENASPIAKEAAQLAREIGNSILLGRQTGDADLFEWGSHGVAIQIMDPNRPAFPIVQELSHPWAKLPGTIWEEEPDDATLEAWAEEGRVLSSLIFHSGEMAHNEAMLMLMDLCSVTGVKLGLGAHLARYETCPQMWELLQIPVSRGGVRGRIEPLLHSGGLGIMAEYNCPPEALYQHCRTALAGIERIAGKENLPKGYYFFCDTDLDTLSSVRPGLYSAVEKAGLAYAVSSVKPGRNRLIGTGIPVLTQTSRTQCQGSPFVRITTVEDVNQSGYAGAPGWFIGVLDSPVISFLPYIWRKGSRFMALLDVILKGRMTNVLPGTVARYAALLEKKGYLPPRLSE